MLLRNGSMGAGISNKSKLAAGERGLLVLFFFKFGFTGSNTQAAGVNQELMLGRLYGVVKGGKCML